MSFETNLDPQNWLDRFSGSLGDDEARRQFDRWKDLQVRGTHLQALSSRYPGLDFSEAQTFLTRAANVLRYDEDYRVVVIGETGAGKSTLLNALLQDKILLTGGGAAITGTAIYVYPNYKVDHDKAEIFLREPDEFKPLLIDLVSRYLDDKARLELFGNEENITASEVVRLATSNQIIQRLANTMPSNEKQSIQEEILDIAKVWEKIDTIQGNFKKEFRLPEERDDLNTYLEEGGSRNKRGLPTRVIPAIKYAKYYLAHNHDSYLNGKISNNVVFIDVPGSAAKTLRHTEILRQEVKNANVVILVVKPDRPAEQEGTSIANLLEQYLFKGYTPEEKRKFASRVFLVVNKADQVKTEEDKSRLDASLSELCEIIGDKNLLKSRCIGVVAEKSILALIRRKNLEIKTDIERDYYAALAKCPVEDLNNVDVEKLDGESGVPILLEKLSQFLSKERVRLMIDEGEVLLEKSVNSIKLICGQVLGLEPSEISPDRLETIGMKEKGFCDQTLEQDRKDLDRARKELIDLVKVWIDSREHQEKVSHKITGVFTRLKDSIKEPAKRLLDPENYREGALHISTSFVTGNSYPNVDVPYLLLATEERFHRAVEDNIRELADYYFSEFDAKVRSLEIDGLLEEKSYGQKYIEDIDPSGAMRELRTQVHENLKAICRWILMYELLKMPIDLPLDPSRDGINNNLSIQAFQEVFKEIAPELISLGEDAIQSMVDDILPLPLKKLIEVFAHLIEEKVEDQAKGGAENQTSKQSPKPKQNKQTRPEKLLDKTELQRKVIEYGASNKIDELLDLLQEQFAFRYSVAVSTALIYLERLFRYELGKYYLKLEETSNLLLGMHKSAVDLNYGDIREQLGKKHPDMSQKFQDASNCLKELLAQ